MRPAGWQAVSGALLLVGLACAQQLPAPGTSLDVPDATLATPLRFIAYGDMRFTDPRETDASTPGARRALVEQIAAERPQALLLSGDLVWHGGEANDYRVFAEETAAWRAAGLHLFPALGNHEFSRCGTSQCLENWWQTFPELRGQRWYSAALGSRIRIVALDSNAPLTTGSEQRRWLEQQLAGVGRDVRFILLVMHHPPLADDGAWVLRANESSLTELLAAAAAHSAARIVVCAGHVHNYERFERDGVLYLVSGGGGAKPLPVVKREPSDRYADPDFPNYHYLRFELRGERLSGEMVRLADYEARAPHVWAVKDRFEVSAAPR
jgi:3',5'-cyclic AMP phosphodiesterase CpdA